MPILSSFSFLESTFKLTKSFCWKVAYINEKEVTYDNFESLCTCWRYRPTGLQLITLAMHANTQFNWLNVKVVLKVDKDFLITFTLDSINPERYEWKPLWHMKRISFVSIISLPSLDSSKLCACFSLLPPLKVSLFKNAPSLSQNFFSCLIPKVCKKISSAILKSLKDRECSIWKCTNPVFKFDNNNRFTYIPHLSISWNFSLFLESTKRRECCLILREGI